MNIKLDKLTLTDYNSLDNDKVKFINDLKNDNIIRKYLYGCIDEMIKQSEGTVNITIGYGYLISFENHIIGFLRIARLYDDTVDIDCAIHQDYRHQGLGKLLLDEISEFLFNNIEYINRINLNILKTNQDSINCAKKSGFIYYKILDDGYLAYTKTRKKL